MAIKNDMEFSIFPSDQIIIQTPVDNEMSSDSENPIQTKVVYAELEKKVDKEEGKQLSTEDYTTDEKKKLKGLPSSQELTDGFNEKVDKIVGKGLSENDYTDKEKNKLQNLPTKEDLDKTLNAVEKTTNKTTVLNEFSTDVQYPTAKTVYDITNELKESVDLLELKTDNLEANKVTKETGKGLSSNDYTDSAKNKVDAIPKNPKYTDTIYDDTELRNTKADKATTLAGYSIQDAYTKAEVEGLISSLISIPVDAMRFMGVIGEDGIITSTISSVAGKNFSELTDYRIGWSFKIGYAGIYADQACEINDMIMCVGTDGTNSDWYVLQANIDGAVIGPTTSNDTGIPMFSKDTGKLLADSGYKKSDIQDLINNKHTHDNKETLDSITSETVEKWNGYDDELVYTNDIPTISAIGGIAAGTTFKNVSITDMFTKILYPYVAPAISTSVIIPFNGGVFEKGSSQTVTKIRVSVGKKSASITKVEIFDGSTSLGEKSEGVANGGNFDFVVDVAIAANKNFKATVTDSEGKSYSANTGTFTFVHPFYIGTCNGDTIISADILTGFTKRIETKSNKTIAYTCDNQSMVFAYDSSYGALKSIIDPNNFNVTDTFIKTEVNITTLDGTTTKYYVYKNATSTVSNFTMKFNF